MGGWLQAQVLTQVVEDSLRVTLARDESGQRKQVELPVVHGGRVRPGVNLDSMSNLLDIMEGCDP